MPTWIIETDTFSEKCFGEMVAHFKATETPYHVIRIKPMSGHTVIEGKVPDVSGPVVVYGSVGVANLALAHNWLPGVFFDPDAFNYESYQERLGDLMLNHDAQRLPMSQVSAWAAGRGDSPFFMRPNGDGKEFAGLTIEAGAFDDWYAKMRQIGYLDDNDFDVVVSSVKNLGVEWRAVVVDGKVSSCSIYRQWQQVMPERHILPEVADLIAEAHSRFAPAPVYVIDVAQEYDANSEYTFKVVEYNCFNSAGFYACDVVSVIDDVNAHVDATYGKADAIAGVGL